MKCPITPLFKPRSVAVVGASRQLGTVGSELFRNLLRCGFNGPVYPVNSAADVVQSVRAYRTLYEIPGPVDLAVIALPAPLVPNALCECGEKGVKVAVVLTAGFREMGAEGSAREAKLREIAQHYDMRLLGPNCLGVLNTDPDVQLNATFTSTFPQPGPVSFISQSGALGAVVLDLAARRNIGLASFVSMGNKCDISGNDLIDFLEHDPLTRVILMYLESFGNPQNFTTIARRVARKKPIVAVKSGRTLSGSRAAASHTGALAGTDIAVDALFRQAGVIRVDTTEELFDTGMLLATQPVPRGRGVGIITNAGGPGILAADACESNGLGLPPLERATVDQLSSFLPPEASVRNPVDMIASASGADYGRAVRILLDDPNVDALLVIFVEPLMTETEDVAAAIAEAGHQSQKPIVTCYMGTHGLTAEGLFIDPQNEGQKSRGIPSYRFPEAAAKALSRAVSYGEWLTHADSPIPEVQVHAGLLRSTVAACRDAVLAEDPPVCWLDPSDVSRLLSAYGIATANEAIAISAEHAERLAEQIGFPVTLKLLSTRMLHKSDVGGVILDRRDHAEVHEAYEQMMSRAEELGIADAIDGVLVQQYVTEGIEAVVGVTHDPHFGPLIMFGLGGAYVELVRDVTFRLHPLTEHDTESMLWSVRSASLLHGYRGAPPGDIPAVRDLLSRVSQMISDLPELIEVDLNPVMVLPPGRGCVVVDARVRLCDPSARRSLL